MQHPNETANYPMKKSLSLFAGLGLLAALAPAASGRDKLVIEAGRIITQTGPDIVDGVVVIDDGRITAMGAADEVKIPWDADVLGGPEFVVFPGFIEAHTNRGMDRANESMDVTPYLNIRDSVDPVDFYWEDCLRWGITTINIQQGNDTVIAGRGMVVKPYGATIEEMLVRPDYGLKVSAAPKRSNSRATQAQALRSAFGDLRRHLEQLVQEKRDGNDRARREALYQGRELEGERGEGRAMSSTGWTVEGLELVPRGEIDEKQEPLLDLVEGNVPAFVYCGSPMDVHLALEVARDNGFLARTTLVLDDSCWKAADAIAEAGVAVVLDSDMVHMERDPVTGEEIETFVPGVFAEKGVRFALSSENANTHSLWYQAALAIGQGLDRQTALDAVTRVPAEILGLGNRLGGLATGRDANLVLFSGDPLSVSSWVEAVLIGGEQVYDRSSDIRNRHLFEGMTPPLTSPMLPQPAGANSEDEGEVPEDEDDGDEDEDEDDDEHEGDEDSESDDPDADEDDDDDGEEGR